MVACVTDKVLLGARLARAHRQASDNAGFLMRSVVADLGERLVGVERRFPLAVACGGQGPHLADCILRTGKVDGVFRLERFAAALRGCRRGGIVADEEALPLRDASIELLVSALALQWTNDLPGALIQIRRALKPDGLFLGAMTGGATLAELRACLAAAETERTGGISPRVMPAADVREMGTLLQRAGFALPVVDRDVLTVRYDTAYQLLADLRAMGATNAMAERSRKPPPPRFFARTAEIYAERFSDPDGRIRATFEIISLSGWAPHDSQQRPARRGSGQISLTDVLTDRGRQT